MCIPWATDHTTSYIVERRLVPLRPGLEVDFSCKNRSPLLPLINVLTFKSENFLEEFLQEECLEHIKYI